jgi:hypothetical protein
MSAQNPRRLRGVPETRADSRAIAAGSLGTECIGFDLPGGTGMA